MPLPSLLVSGVPGLVLATGNLYLLSGEDERLTGSLLWSTLAEGCLSGVSACLVTNPAATLASSDWAPHAARAAASGRLAVFSLDDAARNDNDWMTRLTDDLQHWHVQRKQLLVLDGAEQWFAPAEGAQFEALQAWAKRTGVAVLLIFRASATEGDDVMPALLPHAHRFAGMARIANRFGVTSLEVFHWFAPSGLMAKTSAPVRLNESSRLEAVPEEPERNAGFEPAADDMLIIARQSVFLPKETPAQGWRLLQDNDDLIAGVGNAVAATVILCFSPRTDFFVLARSVYDLRQRFGARLKIVVREANSRLRYSHETFLARVGANLIIPAEIGYARFLSLISMVQGQVFPHRLPATFEQAVHQAMPDEEHGYLAPRDFSRSVDDAMERSHILHVQNVLLRLPLAYGLMPLDALRYCNLTRAGDLVTADDRNVYLFLYACRETDIDKTLPRLFGLPVGELFRTEDRFMSPRTIRSALADFQSRDRAQAFPDLAAELAVIAETRVRATAGVRAPVEKKGPAVLRYPAPQAAVRRALAVKGAPTLTDVSVPLP